MAAVKAAKGSPIYREHRASLACVAPEDVWIDEDLNMTIVEFQLDRDAWKTLCFGVDATTLEVAHAGVVHLDVDEGNWLVTNEGSTVSRSIHKKENVEG